MIYLALLRISVAYLLELLTWAILIKSLFTWVPSLLDTKLYEILCYVTDPIEEPIRNQMVKFMEGPLDFTPVVAILLLSFIKGILI